MVTHKLPNSSQTTSEMSPSSLIKEIYRHSRSVNSLRASASIISNENINIFMKLFMKLSRHANIRRRSEGTVSNFIRGTAFFPSKYYCALEIRIILRNTRSTNCTKRCNITWELKAGIIISISKRTCTTHATISLIRALLSCSITGASA